MKLGRSLGAALLGSEQGGARPYPVGLRILIVGVRYAIHVMNVFPKVPVWVRIEVSQQDLIAAAVGRGTERKISVSPQSDAVDEFVLKTNASVSARVPVWPSGLTVIVPLRLWSGSGKPGRAFAV